MKALLCQAVTPQAGGGGWSIPAVGLECSLVCPSPGWTGLGATWESGHFLRL